MRRALRCLPLFLLFGALVAPAARAQAPAPAPPPEERIRAGVTVAGVDVGNLTVAEATVRLQQVLAPAFARAVVVQAGGKPRTLDPRALKFSFRADRTALRALYAGRAAPPAPDGTLPPASATASVAYDRGPLWRFARRVADSVSRPARDARIRYTLTRLVRRRGRVGRDLRVRPLVKAVQAALKDPLASRVLIPKVTRMRPKVRTKDLARRYGTAITIDRAHFRLRLFKRLKIVKRYPVAVGMADYPTPTGLFSITSKQVNPTWTAPDSPWAGELAGQQVAGGAANNPLRARWLGIVNGVGIHGTGQTWSVGTRASHGCIRMTVPDVIDLFRRVPIGTPVYIR